jgi:hypothetical protein
MTMISPCLSGEPDSPRSTPAHEVRGVGRGFIYCTRQQVAIATVDRSIVNEQSQRKRHRKQRSATCNNFLSSAPDDTTRQPTTNKRFVRLLYIDQPFAIRDNTHWLDLFQLMKQWGTALFARNE